MRRRAPALRGSRHPSRRRWSAPAPITVWISSMKKDRARRLFEARTAPPSQPLLNIAAIARTGKQRAHVEREDRCVEQHLGHFAADGAAGEPLGDRGLADAGVANIERVVLGAGGRGSGSSDRPRPRGRSAGLISLESGLLAEVDAIVAERTVPALLVVLFAAFAVSSSAPCTRRVSTRPGPWQCRAKCN